MNRNVFIVVANVALTGVFWGCGESVPVKDAPGGIMSGTEIDRTRSASRTNPLTGGNGPIQATPGQPSAAAAGTNNFNANSGGRVPGSANANITTGTGTANTTGVRSTTAPAGAPGTGLAPGGAPGAGAPGTATPSGTGTGATPSGTGTGAATGAPSR